MADAALGRLATIKSRYSGGGKRADRPGRGPKRDSRDGGAQTLNGGAAFRDMARFAFFSANLTYDGSRDRRQDIGFPRRSCFRVYHPKPRQHGEHPYEEEIIRLEISAGVTGRWTLDLS